jgi:hypothetical protein
MSSTQSRPKVMEHLPWRITGLLLLGVLVVLYQPDQQDVSNRLVIPMAMTLAAWLLVRNAMAVALGGGLLAAIHSAPGSGDWVSAMAYPALAALGGLVVMAVLVHRFRRHIAATHEERWHSRRNHADRDDES